MGSRNSGRQPGDGPGQRKQMSLVCGTGVPTEPKGTSEHVLQVWNLLEELTRGVTFEQDSMAMEQTAKLWVRHSDIEDSLAKLDPDGDLEKYDILTRLELAMARQLNALFDRLGLNPKSRQTLRVPRETPVEKDEFEQMFEGGN